MLAKKLKIITVLLILITIVLTVCFVCTSNRALLPAAITFGTIAYHFTMRLLVGGAFNMVMGNKADYRKRHFWVSRREISFYEKLNVKKWKDKMPSYDASLFDPKEHTLEEVIQAMCQAELVHETIVILSFLPIIAGIWFGDFPVFIITSVIAAIIDMIFVIMQRYNRHRVMCLIERKNRSAVKRV